MADTDNTGVVADRLSPEEAFELLAHETRFRVLEALNDAEGPLVFTELRVRVGIDDPGKFNYHLGKLVGRFVRKGESGYELAGPGRRIVGGVLSGGYTKALDADSVPMDALCPECGEPLEAQFHENGIRVVCRGCAYEFTDPEIPAGALSGYAREDAPSIVDRWLKRVHAAAEYGFCDNCDGRLERTVTLPTDDGAPGWLTGEYLDATVIYDCERCGTNWQSIVPYAVLTHPTIVSFHYEHGIDLRETPLWDLDWPHFGMATVVNEDPLRIEVPIAIGDETLTCTFDTELNVVAERRE